MILALLAATESRLSSMLVFFFVALLIVSPFGYRRLRPYIEIWRDDRHRPDGTTAEDAGPDTADGPPDDLARVVAAIGAAADTVRADPAARPEVVLPTTPTVDGRPAPAELVRALVDDAVRRSGLTAEWLESGEPGDADGGGAVLRLAPA